MMLQHDQDHTPRLHVQIEQLGMDGSLEAARLDQLFQVSWAITLSIYTCSENVEFRYVILQDEVDRIREVTLQAAVSQDAHIADIVPQVLWTNPTSRGNVEQAQTIMTSVQRQSLSDDGWSLLSTPDSSDEDGESGASSPSRASGVMVPNMLSRRKHSCFQLVVDIARSGCPLQFLLAFHVPNAPDAQVTNMMRTFEHVFNQNLVNHNSLVKQLDLCSVHDMAQIAMWNQSAGPKTDEHGSLLDYISQFATTEPTLTAVDSWDGKLSYAELEERSTKLAAHLLEKGLNFYPEEPEYVPLLFEKSLRTVIAMVAVMKIGCAFVLLDPSQPVQRLQTICTDLTPRLVVCSATLTQTAALLATNIVPLDNDTGAVIWSSSCPQPLPRREPVPDHALYAVFTSGSTGKPKGITIHHYAFLSCARAYVQKVDMNKHTRTLQFASYAFDVSISDTLNSLLAGGCLCIPSELERSSQVAEGVRRLRPTWADLTPSLLRHLSLEDLHTIRTIVLSGEVLPRDVVDSWGGKIRLINVYGPAECSVQSTLSTSVSAESASNIGHAIVGSSWIVDPSDHEKLLPIGAVGELLIEGPHLGRGYINEPEKTRASFIPAPLWLDQLRCASHEYSQHLYCTGDLVQYQADGSLRYIGRKDTQVKLRGQRVELAEVEHHLRVSFPPDTNVVAEVITMKHEDSISSTLVAFLTNPKSHHRRDSGVDVSPEPLLEQPHTSLADIVSAAREKLQTSVPDYMIPSLFLSANHLPLTVSGKVDRRQLREGVAQLSRDELKSFSINVSHGGRRAASTELQRILLWVFERVLNIKPDGIGLDDDFFALGGDSITAMRVVAQCRQEGFILETGDVLRLRTISKLAVAAKPDSSSLTHSSQLTPCEDLIDASFDLSPIQCMFFADSPDGDDYFNQSLFVAASREVDIYRLRYAAHALVEKHSMLRARFSRSENGTWTQRVTDEITGSFRCQKHQISQRSQVTEVMNKSQKTFDLRNGPIISLDLISIDGDPHPYLFIVTHHAVIDLVSYRILLEDLEQLLTNETAASSLEAPTPFQWWCHLQAEHAQTKLHPEVAFPTILDIDAEAIDQYWALGNLENTYGNAQSTPLLIDEAITSAILTTANKAFQTQPVELLNAALLHSFLRVFGDRAPPTIFNEGHGREPWDPSIDLSRTVGWFTTIWPTPVDYTHYVDNDAVDLVRRVKDGRRTVSGNGMPYFASRYLNEDGKAVFGKQKMEIVFNFHGKFQQFERENSLFHHVPWEYEHSSDYGADTVLPGLFEITCVVVHGRLQFEFIYGKELAHQTKIGEWIEECRHSLEDIATKLSSIPTSIPTLVDLPFLSLGYSDLDYLINALPESGISWVDVEDIYPCLPMQEGILLSQVREAKLYRTGSVLEFKHDGFQCVDIDHLIRAWEQVVNRHSVLRTIASPSGLSSHSFNNVVLKPSVAISSLSTVRYKAYDDEHVERSSILDMLQKHRGRSPPPTQTSYQIKLFASKNPSSVYCDIEFNHAIMDGWSSSVLVHDWVAAYNNCLSAEDPVQYRDYVSYVLSKQSSLVYWQNYLAQTEVCLFPTLVDHGDTSKNRLYNVDVQIGLSDEAIGDFLKARGATVSNLFHVAWALLLRSYTGSDNVCFGYLASGRDAPIAGIEDAVGLFANLLPCRINFTADDSPLSLLQDSQADLAQAFSHQHAPMTEVLANLNLQGQALFNTVVSIQSRVNATESAPIFPSRELMVEELEEVDPTEYALALNVFVTGDKLKVYLSSWTSMISPWQANHIADTFGQIISQIVCFPEQKVMDVSLLGNLQRKILTTRAYKMPIAINECVHELFQKQALSRPTSPAVCAWDGDLSYEQLNERSSLVALALRDVGVGKGNWVALYIERSSWVPVAMLAVMKSGAAFVLLEPSFPPARLQQICTDVNATVVLTSKSMAERAKQIQEKTIAIDDIQQQSPSKPLDTTISTVSTPQDAMYAIFTSGSTGRPKGVVIEHGSFASGVFAHAAAARYTAESRVFQSSSFAFDACLAEILTTILVGGCICIPSEDDKWNDMSGSLARLQANFLFVVPSMLRTLDPRDFPSLKTVLTGGEPPNPRELQQWADNAQLIQMYGPSECSVYCAATEPLQKTSNGQNIGTIIGAVPWIVDMRNINILAPVGAVGELILEGPIVGREYLNRPEQTAAAFIDPPIWRRNFASYPRRKLYRTGDMAQFTKNGTIRLLGRKDTQVKLRGQRIELGEIEHGLRDLLPYCSHITVEMVKFENGVRPTELVAFLEGAEENEANCGSHDFENGSLVRPMHWDLRTRVENAKIQLSNRLPHYMIPDTFLAVKELPKSASGKVDLKRLRSEAAALIQSGLLENESFSIEASRQIATTPAERVMLGLVSEVLGRSQASLSAENNFFKIGGDSLRAIKLVQLCRSRNIKLSVQDIFRAPQISEMASAVQMPEKEEPPVPIERERVAPFSLLDYEVKGQVIREVVEKTQLDEAEIEDIYPCTPLQEGMISLSLRSPSAYVAQSTYALPPDCDLTQLREAWSKVVKANFILRTRIFQHNSEGALQVVLQKDPEWFEGDSLRMYLKMDQEIPMGIMDPLLRLAVVTENTDNGHQDNNRRGKSFMVVTMHHAIYDGWSEGLILNQLTSAYAREAIPQCQFPRFIKFIKETQHLAEAFWKMQMHNLETPSAVFPSSPLPNYVPVPTASCTRRMDLTEGHTSSHFTLSSQLRLAWALVMHHFTTSEAVVFGVIVNGRSDGIPGIEQITGPTLANLPCRVTLTPSQTIEESLSEIQKHSSSTLPFEQYGLQNIRALSETAAMECQFQSLLVVQPQTTPDPSQLLCPIDTSEVSSQFDTYPLTLQCNINDGHVELQASYDDQIIPTKMMHGVIHHFKHAFKEIASDTTRPVAQITSISPEDTTQLTDWYHELQLSQPQVSSYESLVVHDLIRKQCQSQPTAAAVHAWDGSFSYSQVDQLSSALAVYLAQVGVELESIVPVCFGKSKWLPVITLGVLKAGAAFVLLDPASQPLQRMQLIIEEVKGKVVITSETLFLTASDFPGVEPVVISDDSLFLTTNVGCEDVVLPTVGNHNALYAIFTSGSTGKPKGVVIEHGGYTVSALARQKITGLDNKSRVLQFSSCVFDTFITDILDTLIAGACICIPSESDRHAQLGRAANEMRVTHADLVPSVARLLDPRDIPTLESLALSGESLAAADIDLWADKVRLCNLYGPAECSATATGHIVTGPHPNASNIGRGSGGFCWIVNPGDHEKLLPIGAIGELVLEGPIVGRGYLGHVHGSASTNFVSVPPAWRQAFPHGDEGCRMYRTGDLVQYNADGALLFIGRKDNQVKLNGQRLELGDVEHHLRSVFPTALDVVADVAETSASKKRLVAFVVVGGNQEIHHNHEQQPDVGQILTIDNMQIATSMEFRTLIRDAETSLRISLPGFMVPTAYFPIKVLPRMPSGKIDRRRLKQLASDLIAHEGLEPFTAVKNKRAPSTVAEKILQAIWAKVLGREASTIGAEDGFLQLGGDSIAAMRVASIAMSESLNLSISKLFQNESLQSLAATAQPDKSGQAIDWAKEVALPSDMQALASDAGQDISSIHSSSPTEILLTGATGCLGREILQQLIESPNIGVIHCVAVRSPEQISPNEKIVVYKGDFSLPRLGMTEQEETAVVQQCRAVIHCGALVSFVQNYESLRTANVESTKYLAKLALKSQIPFHYVSTTGVGGEEGQAVIEEVSAASSLPPADGNDGYTATKWASEVFLEKVNSEFGLPVVIHRPSNIISDCAPETDIVNNLLKYSRRMRMSPHLGGWEGHFDLIQAKVAASNIIGTVNFSIQHTVNDQACRREVQYIHESGETIFSVDAFRTYLEGEEEVSFETVELKVWIENAVRQGMSKLVGEFLTDTEATGDTISLPLIRSSRQS